MANDILKTAWGDLDVSTSPIYATQFGDGSTYGLEIEINGKTYAYVPEDIVKNGGKTSGTYTYALPWLANKDNLSTFGQNASTVDLSNVDFADWLKNNNVNTKGYLVDYSKVPFDSDVQQWSTEGLKGSLSGLKSYNGNIVYGLSGGHGNRYLTGSGEVHDPYTTYSSILGDTFGGIGEALAGGISDVFQSINSLGPLGTTAISAMNPLAGAAIAGANVGTAAAQGNLSAADIAKQAAAAYAGSQVGAQVGAETGSNALGNAAGTTSAGLLSGQDLGTALTSGAFSGAGTGIANGINASNSATAGKDYTAGANYSAPSTGGGLGLKASMGEGTDLFGNLSGGDGLNALKALFGGANLFSMGGGQGLTIPSATGSGTLGANGIGNAWGVNSGTSASTPLDANNAIASGGNVIGAGTVTSLLKSLFGGSSGTGTKNMATDTTNNNAALGSLLGGLLGGAGGLMQGSTNTEAMKQYANAITQAGQQAQNQAAFRPVGMTTSFGTSNFTIDPTTGQITNAGYSLSPQLQAAQEGVLGGLRQNLTDAQTQAALGRSYLAQNPQQVASNWLSQQQALLAPSRDTAWARLNQGNYNQGTMGLKVAQGGNLQAANPYASALANAQAQQDAQLAAQAQQQGQQAVKFGQGLLSSAYDPMNAGLTTSKTLEALGQNPYGLSTDLANTVSQRGAVTGGLGLKAADAAAMAMKQANTYNPYASILSGLGTSSTAGNVLGGLLGNTSLGSSLGNWLSNLNFNNLGQAASDWMAANPDITPQSTVDNGNYDFLDPELRKQLGLD